MKKLIIVLVIAVSGLVGLCVYGATLPDSQFESPKVAILQDPKLLAESKQLGIDVSGVNLRYSDNLSASNARLGEPLKGAFSKPNTIFIKPDTNIELKILAHEYMHYIRYNMSLSESKAISEKVRPYFEVKYKYLLDPYKQDQNILDDEGHSFICTSINPNQLSVEINTYCNKFIPNRQLLFN